MEFLQLIYSHHVLFISRLCKLENCDLNITAFSSISREWIVLWCSVGSIVEMYEHIWSNKIDLRKGTLYHICILRWNVKVEFPPNIYLLNRETPQHQTMQQSYENKTITSAQRKYILFSTLLCIRNSAIQWQRKYLFFPCHHPLLW